MCHGRNILWSFNKCWKISLIWCLHDDKYASTISLFCISIWKRHKNPLLCIHQGLKCCSVGFDPCLQDLHQSLIRWINEKKYPNAAASVRINAKQRQKNFSLSLLFLCSLKSLNTPCTIAVRKSYGIIIAAAANKNNIIRGKEMAIMFNKKLWQTKYTAVISNRLWRIDCVCVER